MTADLTKEEVEKLKNQLQKEAAVSGYNLNPDEEFTFDLIEALLTNTLRYGYQSCPCRLAEGDRGKDLDIICPCDYRDPDLAEFGSCYCALYVSDEIARGEREAGPIPERRRKTQETGKRRNHAFGVTGLETERESATESRTRGHTVTDLEYPVWRCSVCGYLCAREHPPEKCPICKADKDRFKKFL